MYQKVVVAPVFMSQYKMPGCSFVQVIQDGVCLSLDGTLSGVYSKYSKKEHSERVETK